MSSTSSRMAPAVLGTLDEPSTGRLDHRLAAREQVRVLAERRRERAHQAALHRPDLDVLPKPLGQRLAWLGIGLEESIALRAQAFDLARDKRPRGARPG